MNTALNFISVPKDSAPSTASTESPPSKLGASPSDSAAGRQDLADAGEKNATFAKVLKDESHPGSTNNDAGKGGKGQPTTGEAADDVETNEKTTGGAANSSSEAAQNDATQSTENNARLTTQSAKHTAEDAEFPEFAAAITDTEESVQQSEAAEGTVVTEQHERTQINIESSLVLRESIARALKGESFSNAAIAGQSATKSDPAVTQTAQLDSKPSVSADSIAAAASVDTSKTSAAANTTTLTNANIGAASDVENAGQHKLAPSFAMETVATKNELAGDSQPHGVKQEAQSLQVDRQALSSSNQPQATPANQTTAHEVAQQSLTSTVASVSSGKQPENLVAASTNPELTASQNKSAGISSTASLESFPAAGKTLSPTGNNLPAGLFFQGEGEAPIASRGEHANQATQPIDLNSAIAEKQSANKQSVNIQQDFDKGFEFSSDRLMRSMLSATTPTADALAPTTVPQSSSDSALSTPPLSSPLLHVSADKTIQDARTTLSSSGEPALKLNIAAQAGSAEWQSQLSGRIRWMGNLNISSAELKLHPAELGAIEVQISTEDDQTRVSFITNNAAAKEVIESTLPRLRELLGEGGLQLEQGDVAQRNLSDEKQARDIVNGERTENEESEDGELQQANIHITRNSTSQVDHYV